MLPEGELYDCRTWDGGLGLNERSTSISLILVLTNSTFISQLGRRCRNTRVKDIADDPLSLENSIQGQGILGDTATGHDDCQRRNPQIRTDQSQAESLYSKHIWIHYTAEAKGGSGSKRKESLVSKTNAKWRQTQTPCSSRRRWTTCPRKMKMQRKWYPDETDKKREMQVVYDRSEDIDRWMEIFLLLVLLLWRLEQEPPRIQRGW